MKSQIKLRVDDVLKIAREVKELIVIHRDLRSKRQFKQFKEHYVTTFAYRLRCFFGKTPDDVKILEIMEDRQSTNRLYLFSLSYPLYHDAKIAASKLITACEHAILHGSASVTSSIYVGIDDYSAMSSAHNYLPTANKKLQEELGC